MRLARLEPAAGEELAPSARLAGRRVLLTGATGFIGRHVMLRLVREGARVTAVSRRPRRSWGVGWQALDLGDAAGVGAAMERHRPELVVHLASHVTGARAVEHVGPTLRANLLSTVNLLTAAVAMDRAPRVVLAGSMEEPRQGGDATVPPSPYAAAKWAGAAYGRMFEALYGLDTVHLRLFMVYGPGQRDLSKLVPYVTVNLLAGRSPAVTSGVRRVDWVYVEDVADAVARALAVERTPSHPLDVGSGRRVSVREVVERIGERTGRPELIRFGAAGERPLEAEPVADVAAAREHLGWEARTPLDAGLDATVSWYRRRLRRRVTVPRPPGLER